MTNAFFWCAVTTCDHASYLYIGVSLEYLSKTCQHFYRAPLPPAFHFVLHFAINLIKCDNIFHLHNSKLVNISFQP